MKNITSIKTYIDTIMQLRSDPSCEEYPNYQWFFRGQKDSTWSVEPSIFRNDGVAKEYELIQSALRTGYPAVRCYFKSPGSTIFCL